MDGCRYLFNFTTTTYKGNNTNNLKIIILIDDAY